MGLGEPARSLVNTHAEEARNSPKETARQQREKRLKGARADLGMVGGQGLSAGLLFLVINCGGRERGKPEGRAGWKGSAGSVLTPSGSGAALTGAPGE